jgi:hypothetical protein
LRNNMRRPHFYEQRGDINVCNSIAQMILNSRIFIETALKPKNVLGCKAQK